MPLTTTTLGAYPKPDYVPTPSWFDSPEAQANPSQAYQLYLQNLPENIEEILVKATHEVIQLQVDCGIDIPTDGEIRRENYIYYQCRNFQGFDFENLTKLSLRNGAWEAEVPTISGKIEAGEPILPSDYQIAQAATQNPIKITLPGPLTIVGSTANIYYDDPAKLGADLAKALNREVLALVEAGCKWIQIDEPVFARTPEPALDYGFANLEQCFDGVPDDVTKVVHMCCGYPRFLDDHEYEKADRNVYFKLADAIDQSCIDAISIEDAHVYNDLTLLEKFQNTAVLFGSIAIAKSRVEPVEEIANRLNQALQHIDADRLIVAPDCGLGFLTQELTIQKLTNMSKAAKMVG